MDDLVVIWSEEHGAWWRSASCGHTTSLREAGLYPAGIANEIVANANFGGRFNEVAMKRPPLPAFKA